MGKVMSEQLEELFGSWEGGTATRVGSAEVTLLPSRLSYDHPTFTALHPHFRKLGKACLLHTYTCKAGNRLREQNQLQQHVCISGFASRSRLVHTTTKGEYCLVPLVREEGHDSSHELLADAEQHHAD